MNYDPHNRRLKLFRLGAADLDHAAVRYWLDGLDANHELYSKLIVYGLPGYEPGWTRYGYRYEGTIHGYFGDGADTWIWSAFACNGRDQANREQEHDRIIDLAEPKPAVKPRLPRDLTCRQAGPEDATRLAVLLQQTFPDYPTSIDQSAIRHRIETGANLFRLIQDRNERILATASAEIDHRRRSAELTDCATRPEHRGSGLMLWLLNALKQDMADDHGITDLYTLARADEPGMNCAFSKLGWEYTGRLVNNCRMPNGWESMNLWCPPRSRP
jgi:putative beta-lysine N-acetyltransferase